MSRYAIHAASIERDGLRLSEEPRAVTDCASEALRLSDSLRGSDGGQSATEEGDQK